MKKTCTVSLVALVAATFPIYAQPAFPPTNVSDYEELPELKASEILRPEILSGPHHKVQESVPTYSGSNHFSIESDFGAFEAEGNEMLIRRINEIDAVARLKEVSRTDQYKDALVKAAKSPVAAAKSIVTNPVGTISSMPKGLMKFMGRARESVKGIGKKGDSNAAEGSKTQQTIGFTDAKRKVAVSLGVGPYSTNPVLQKELDGIAWASFAGGLTFQIATMPIGGPALTVVGVTSTFQDVLRDKSPTDLKIMNRKILLGMGASAADAEAFLNNSAFSPSEQTAFVLNLKSLEGVANRGAFVGLAAKVSSDEADAIFCVETAELMGNLHNSEKPLARIALIGDFPICIAKDGTVVVALQWDYAAWTPLADRFARDVKMEAKGKSYLAALSGAVSPRLREELESRGFRVQNRLSPGPLK